MSGFCANSSNIVFPRYSCSKRDSSVNMRAHTITRSYKHVKALAHTQRYFRICLNTRTIKHTHTKWCYIVFALAHNQLSCFVSHALLRPPKHSFPKWTRLRRVPRHSSNSARIICLPKWRNNATYSRVISWICWDLTSLACWLGTCRATSHNITLKWAWQILKCMDVHVN